MPTYTVKRGDTAPVVTDTLLDGNGAAVSLTGAAVKFHMSTWDRVTVVTNASATGPNGGALDITGRVQYAWASGDVAAAGVYKAEWEVTFAGGKIETWPGDSYAVVNIPSDLA
jgi:hypothetical protein